MYSVTLNATDIIELSLFEPRLIQAAKSKSSSCPRKNPLVSCGPFVKRCQRQSLESENWFQTYKICLVSTARSSHAQGAKTLPGMHCDHILQMFLELVTRSFVFFSFPYLSHDFQPFKTMVYLKKCLFKCLFVQCR